MKKQSLYAIIGGIIIAVTLLVANANGKDKHYIVKLKGNVLYARHSGKNSVDKQIISSDVALKQDKKRKKIELPIENKTEMVSVTLSESKPLSTTVQKNILKTVSFRPNGQFSNYEQTLTSIHTRIYGLFPGTYLDSMSIVNQLLNDSIRNELSKFNDKDKAEYLRICLSKSLQDSITLDRLNSLSSPDRKSILSSKGVLIVHCKDASSERDMDSVVMDVFSGSTLVASASSDKSGTIQYTGIPEGNYYVVFSRKSYAPFSLMRVNVAGVGQSYIDIPLNRQDGYLFQMFGKNAWLYVTTGIILFLLIITIMAYYLAKFNARKELRTA